MARLGVPQHTRACRARSGGRGMLNHFHCLRLCVIRYSPGKGGLYRSLRPLDHPALIAALYIRKTPLALRQTRTERSVGPRGRPLRQCVMLSGTIVRGAPCEDAIEFSR